VTPVLRTARGYQIIKVESVSDTNLKSFEDAKEDISQKIANGKREGEYVKYIEKLRTDAIIDWKNDEVKKAYEVGLKLPRASAQ
jgi:parvulin-like peptidyl-prolyl isomerase